MENIKLNLDIDQDRDTFFLVVNYLKSIGQINKSYELIAKRELSNDNKLNFYTKNSIVICNGRDDRIIKRNIKLNNICIQNHY